MVPDDPDFDAIAAAKELDDFLGEESPYEAEIADLKAQLERANERAAREIEAASKRIAAAADKELEQRTRKLLEGFLDVVDDLLNSGEHVPEAFADRHYSGEFKVRIPPELHRRLAIRAAEEHVSLNRLVSARLAS